MIFKTAISVVPVPPILYFTNQVWAYVVRYAYVRVVYTLSGVLPFFMFVKAVVSIGPVPPILYF